MARAVDVRIENRVKIHVHEVAEIALVAGSDRVNGFVGIRHCIEEGVEASLDELDKGIADRKIAAAAKDGVLDDVRDAGGIGRGRAEADVEDFVVVGVRHHEDARAALLMAQEERVGIDVVKERLLFDGVGGELRDLRGGGESGC